MGILGNAQWNDLLNIDAETALSGTGLILGRRFNLQTGEPEPGFIWVPPGKHLLSLAGTRSGKGTSLILPNLLRWRGSTLVIDPKGENAWITAPQRRKLGQKVYILDPWDEVNQRYGKKAGTTETVARFNPLSILDPADPEFVDDVAYLAEAMIIVTPGQGAYFDESARDLIAGLIAFTVESPDLRPEASFGMVRELLCQSGEVVRELAERAVQLGPRSLAARKLTRFTQDRKDLDAIVSTAITQTGFLDSPTLQASMAASDFSFEELASGNATIYLVLPADKLDTYGRWLRLMVSIGLNTIIASREQSRLPCLFILDERGSALGRLPAVARAYSLLAGLGCICWGFEQDLNMLKRDYPEWETFLGNSQALTAFGIGDAFTSEHVSSLLGTTTIDPGLDMIKRIKAKKPAARAAVRNLMGYQLTTRRLMLPEEVRGLRDDAGIMISDLGGTLFSKISYFSDPDFAPLARPDPRYPPVQVAQSTPPVPVAARRGPLIPPGGIRKAAAALCFLLAAVTFVSAFFTPTWNPLYVCAFFLAIGWIIHTRGRIFPRRRAQVVKQ